MTNSLDERPTYSNPYYYNHQIRNYVLQFMAIFAQMQVSVGKRDSGQVKDVTDCDGNVTGQEPIILDERLISVPIRWGAPDRVVASLFAENTQNKPVRLPIMSVFTKNFEMANDIRHGTGNVRRNTYLKTGGLIPEDIEVVYQDVPNYLYMDLELNVFTSNVDHLFQILEQIWLMFNPQMNLQTNDALFDWTRLTSVELTGHSNELTYPIGTDPRIVQYTLLFRMPIYISAPAVIRKDFIEKIFMRVGVVSQITNLNDSYEIIAELDKLGIEYELVQSVDDLPFK